MKPKNQSAKKNARKPDSERKSDSRKLAIAELGKDYPKMYGNAAHSFELIKPHILHDEEFIINAKRLFEKLDERRKRIVSNYYGPNGKSAKAIGLEDGIIAQRVFQIINQSIERIALNLPSKIKERYGFSEERGVQAAITRQAFVDKILKPYFMEIMESDPETGINIID